MSDESNEAEYGLVMPFVAVASKGGPHDDDAYVAGYEAGQLDEALNVLALFGAVGPIRRTLHDTNQGQADLIAMRHGYSVTFTEAGDGWVQATFDDGASRQGDTTA